MTILAKLGPPCFVCPVPAEVAASAVVDDPELDVVVELDCEGRGGNAGGDRRGGVEV